MTIIWYAIAFYVIGIATVLYIRPEFMFQTNGMWKEFGLAKQSTNTVFPFWMFAIVWAIFSYALATLLGLFFSSITLQAMNSNVTANAATTPTMPNIQPISTAPNMIPMPPPPPPISAADMAAATIPKVPGYYMLNTSIPAEPRYVYYGPEPPMMGGGMPNRIWMPMN
jgi:hypothetical protein